MKPANNSPVARVSAIVQTFREHLLKGFAANFVLSLSLQGAVVLSGIVVARLLGLEDFGAYALIVSAASTLSGIGQGGTGLTATKYVGEYLRSDPAQVDRVLRLCLVMALSSGFILSGLLVFRAEWVASDLFGHPSLAVGLRYVSIAILFLVLVGYQFGALQGFGSNRHIARSGVISGIAYTLCTVIGAATGGFIGAAIGFAVASITRALSFGWSLSRARDEAGIPQQTGWSLGDSGVFTSFALPAWLSSIVTLPCLWGVTVLVARQPDGLAAAGMFAVIHQLRLIVLQLPTQLTAVAFGALSREKGKGLPQLHRRIFWTNALIGVAFSAGLVVVLGVFAEQLLGLYGPQFRSGEFPLIILLLSVVPEIVGVTAYQLVQSSGRLWRSLAWIVTPRDVGYLALALFWVPLYGITGAAFAYLVAQTFGALATIIVANDGFSSLLARVQRRRI